MRPTAIRIASTAAIALAFALGGAAPVAADPTPLPTLDGHVSDPNNQISASDRLALDHRLEAYRQQTGFAIVAFVVTSLNGESIDDYAYRAFNTWKIGEAGKDNGILIMIATGDRKVRIETGKGVGGSLTDLQANDIIRNDMAPLLKQNNIVGAIDAAAAKIEAATKGDPSAHAVGAHGASDSGSSGVLWILLLVIGPCVLIYTLGMLFSPRFRAWSASRSSGQSSGGYYGGNSYSSPSSYSGSSGSSSDTGSGYSGDGGSSGGGGSSDSY